MGAPKGSHNGRGQKGRSGRKSFFQEKADATFLWKVFTEKLDSEELKKILRDKHSIQDVWLTKAFAGNEKFIQQIIHKLFPDASILNLNTSEKIELNDGQIRKIAKYITARQESDGDSSK